VAHRGGAPALRAHQAAEAPARGAVGPSGFVQDFRACRAPLPPLPRSRCNSP
jgi:hypothetical protein